MSTCVAHLDAPAPARASADHDPVGLVEFLETSRRFHKDTGVGALMHPGKLSYRESVPHHSMHILIVGKRVSAHVDRYSPRAFTQAGTVRYSLLRTVAHNLAHLGEELVRVLSGRRGEHRCVLDCERIEIDEHTVDALLLGACARSAGDE